MVQVFVNGKLRTGNWHSNGGGFVESSASCSSDSYLGPMCKVIDIAQVSESCHIDGQVIISHEAIVSGASNLSQHAWVRDSAVVTGGASISGYATVRDSAVVTGGSMTDQAVARSNAVVTNETLINYESRPFI